MYTANSETSIDLSNLFPSPTNSRLDLWLRSNQDRALQLDQFVAPQRFIRKWNRLSRFQRSLVYGLIIVITAVIVLWYYSSLQPPNVEQKDQIEVNSLKNVSRIESDPAVNVAKPDLSALDSENLERPIFTGPRNARQFAVVESFKHAWKGYKEYAWGHDNLKPVSKMPHDWFTLGLTIVDGLDTAYIMGLNEEFEEGKQWISNELSFTKTKDVNLFEVTIRVLGALLSNFYFTQDAMFLEKAIDLGGRLLPAFSTPSGIPFSDVNLSTRVAHSPEWSHYSTTAEVSTVQLEFRELSRATNNPSFEDAASAVSRNIHLLPKKHGLVPIFINPNSGHFLPHATITMGARGDSYYEYLLKQWIQTGKTIKYLLDDYLAAIEGVRDLLAKRSSPNKRLFIGEFATGTEVFNPKMDHLTCFLPGTLALGHANGLPDWHMIMAEELLYTCYLTYAAQPTFLAPEITHFNMANAKDDMYTKTGDAHSLLRPEFVESLWYMYQITGNTTYQDWGWQIFEALEKYAKVENGYTSLNNVKSEKPTPRDMMESFFLSETLKYLYLLFAEDRFLIDLNKFVINSEAHALPIHKN